MSREEDIHYDGRSNDGGGVKTPEVDRLAELPQSLRIGLGGIVKIAPPSQFHLLRASRHAQLYREALGQPYHGLIGGMILPFGYTSDGTPYHDFEGLQRLHDRERERGSMSPWNITAKIVNNPTDTGGFERAVDHVARLVDENMENDISIDALEVSAETIEDFRSATKHLFDLGVPIYMRFGVGNEEKAKLLGAIAEAGQTRFCAKFMLKMDSDFMEGIRALCQCMKYAIALDIPFSIGGFGPTEDRLVTRNNVGVLNLLLASAKVDGEVRRVYDKLSPYVIKTLKESDMSEFDFIDDGIAFDVLLHKTFTLSQIRKDVFHGIDCVGVQNLSADLDRVRATLQPHQ